MVQVKILKKAWPSKMGASAHANRLGGSVKGEVKSIEDWVGGWVGPERKVFKFKWSKGFGCKTGAIKVTSSRRGPPKMFSLKFLGQGPWGNPDLYHSPV